MPPNAAPSPDPLQVLIDKAERMRLPMLRHTADALHALAIDENTPYNRISRAMDSDPLMITRLFRDVFRKYPAKAKEVNTTQQAIMVLGYQYVLDIMPKTPVLEDKAPKAICDAILNIVARAYQASRQAHEWTRQRHDIKLEEVSTAALLYDLGEILLWLLAPIQMQQLQDMIDAGQSLDEAEYVALGFSLQEFTLRLVQAWHLSHLLETSLEPENAKESRAYGIMLANRLVRNMEYIWDDEAGGEFLVDVAGYMQATQSEAREILGEIAYRSSGVEPLASTPYASSIHAQLQEEYGDEEALTQQSGQNEQEVTITRPDPVAKSPPPPEQSSAQAPGGVCLMPQRQVYEDTLKKLKQQGSATVHEIVHDAMYGMHEGIGLNRVVFALLSHDRERLVARYLRGTDNEPAFNRFSMELDSNHLFTMVMHKPQSIWIGDDNRKKFWILVPDEVKQLIQTDTFFCSSVFVRNKPVGMFYADRHNADCQLDRHSYEEFKRISQLTARRLATASNKPRH